MHSPHSPFTSPEKPGKRLSPLSFPLSFLLTGLVLYLSFFTPPSTDLGEVPGFDKVVHIGMYGVLSGIVWIEYLFHYPENFRLRTIFLIGWLIPVLLSAGVEFGQEYLTDNRSGDVWDFCANLTGATLASLLCHYRIRPHREQIRLYGERLLRRRKA